MSTPDGRLREGPHRVVGGGFGGLQAVRRLRALPVSITLIDRRSFHLFQPLVYQVATGMLSAGEIAAPLRAVLKRDANVRVLLGEVSGFDLDRREVLVEQLPNGDRDQTLPYDSLIVAAGSWYSYFGHDEWRCVAPDVRSLESALAVRRRILSAFEVAEVEHDPARREAWLTFVVVGGGPTGVELAGQIAEVGRGGRVAVGPDLTLRGHPEVLALGDMAGVHDAQGRPVALPGLAPVAMQQGRYAARLIDDRLHGRRTPPFHYHDKGSLATIGRAKAVADFRWVRPGGLPAWLAWLLVHGFYLIGRQNRLIVMTRWMFSFFTRGGHARLITGSEVSTAARTRELIHS